MNRPFTFLMFIVMLSINIKAQSYKDAKSALEICAKGNYQFDNISGYGEEELSYYRLNCFSSSFAETNSIWMKMTCDKDGILTFIVTPNLLSDDIDFVLFKQVGEERKSLVPIRCMASGSNSVKNNSRSINDCSGATGLDIYSIDQFEKTGCSYNDNNFLKFASLKRGETYYLVVNNYSSSRGFNISFDGTCEFAKLTACKEGKYNNSFMDLIIHPNPFVNALEIQYKAETINTDNKIQIIDFTGKVFYETHFANDSKSVVKNLELANIPSGSYIVSVIHSTTRHLQKVIKI